MAELATILALAGIIPVLIVPLIIDRKQTGTLTTFEAIREAISDICR